MKRLLNLLLLALLGLATACDKAPRKIAATPTPPIQGPRGEEIGEPGAGEFLVSAHWSAAEGRDLEQLRRLGSGADYLLGLSSQMIPERIYQSKDFEGFLPPKEVKVGDIWKVRPGTTPRFLSQLYPSVSEEMQRDGEGSYALLRARAKNSLDIVFRAHVQFKLPEESTLTPGQFAGRLLLNPNDGSVQYIAFSLPTDHIRNVNFEFRNVAKRFINPETVQRPPSSLVGSVFVPRMELVGGDNISDKIEWDDEVELSQARRSLATHIFPSEEIAWVPFERILDESEKTGKPIFAVVIEGVLSDQSC